MGSHPRLKKTRGAAPAGGAVIALSSSTTQLQPPATVTIPAGQTSVSIEISTAPVATDEAALLTATWDATSREASIQILAPVVQALALEPSTLHGGSSVGGTITLTGPSPSGGRNVTMTTTRPDVAAPRPAVFVVEVCNFGCRTKKAGLVNLGIEKSRELQHLCLSATAAIHPPSGRRLEHPGAIWPFGATGHRLLGMHLA